MSMSMSMSVRKGITGRPPAVTPPAAYTQARPGPTGAQPQAVTLLRFVSDRDGRGPEVFGAAERSGWCSLCSDKFQKSQMYFLSQIWYIVELYNCR